MAEPATRRTGEDGGKFYQHPTRTTVENGGGPRLYDSVTTALSAVDKSALKYWAAGLAAQRAMDNLPRLLGSQLVEPCGRAYARQEPWGCGQCPECTKRWVELYHHGEAARRRREGSAAHDALEWRILHGAWPNLDYLAALQNQDETQDRIDAKAIEPYVEQLKRWFEDYGLTSESFVASELTVWHHVHGYAGTLDAILVVEPITKLAAKLCARVCPRNPYAPVTVVIDCKTREKPDKEFYEEYGLQLAPYRHAETALPKNSIEEVPMPKTDGGCILQLRPGSYSFEPVYTDAQELNAFLNVLAMYRWSQRRGAASIAVKSFPVPEGWTYQEGAYVRGRAAEAVAAPAAGTTTETPALAWEAPPATPAPAKKTSPAKRAGRKTAPPTFAPRVRNATVDSLTVTGGKSRAGGNTLSDDDIPF
jgi:hypothetical protein